MKNGNVEPKFETVEEWQARGNGITVCPKGPKFEEPIKAKASYERTSNYDSEGMLTFEEVPVPMRHFDISNLAPAISAPEANDMLPDVIAVHYVEKLLQRKLSDKEVKGYIEIDEFLAAGRTLIDIPTLRFPFDLMEGSELSADWNKTATDETSIYEATIEALIQYPIAG